MIGVWHLMLAFMAGWFCTMTSGALFAFIVFRTKREAYEPFFGAKDARGGAFNNDPYEEIKRDEIYPKAENPAPDFFEAANQRVAEAVARDAANGITGGGLGKYYDEVKTDAPPA